MPLGDADIASGVFFCDFGVSVVFGDQPAVKGILDAPGKDAMYGDQVVVSNQDHRLEVAGVAFTPFPGPDDLLVVDGQRYKVRSTSPVDDGATVEIKLRKLK